MSRLILKRPDELDDSQALLYDAIARGRRAEGPSRFRLVHDDGSLTGPFNALLYAPAVGDALQRVGEAIRFHSSIPPRARELAILTVAAHRDSDFERYAHEPIAHAAGLPAEIVETLRSRGVPVLEDPIEQAVFDVTSAIVQGDPIDDDLYDRAEAMLGSTLMVELTVLVGYYTTLAMLLDTFAVGVPSDTPEQDDV